jgi:hypothetical protein
MEKNHCPVLLNYFERMYLTFNGVLHKPITPLPTTYAWKLIENPAPFSFKHISYFIISEAGIAWDLSSNVFEENVEILGGRYLGSLVEHATSCSLWEEEMSGWVTTICQEVQQTLLGVVLVERIAYNWKQEQPEQELDLRVLHPESLWEQETDHVLYILEPHSALRGQ